MQKWPAPNRLFSQRQRACAAFVAWRIAAAVALLSAIVALIFVAASKHSPRKTGRPIVKHDAQPAVRSIFRITPSPTPISIRKARATWYDVPAGSLADRRAAADEFTAAHDRLPLGTLVRVTHLKNHKSVLVRITDRGIHNRRVQLDLCKEAAEELGMIRQGVARVRMEVLPDVHRGEPPATETAAP